jgi:ABC-type Fe3+-hydroxamate transport system substrate-binding protein
VFIFSDNRHGWVADRNGLIQGVLVSLGLANAWRGDPSFWGFAVVGVDGLAAVGDAGIVYGAFGLDDLRPVLHSPIWQALPAVRSGRTGSIPGFWYFGGIATAVRLARQITDCLVAMPAGKSAS